MALFLKSNEDSDDDPLVIEEIQTDDEDSIDKDLKPKVNLFIEVIRRKLIEFSLSFTKATHSPVKRGEKFNEYDSKLFIKLMKKYSKVLSSRELTKAAINAKKEVSFIAFYNH